MNKEQFLDAIRERIKDLPESDIERSLDYYAEMIDDRIEEGMSPEQAVKALGSVDEIVLQIRSELCRTNTEKTKVTSYRRMRVWEIVLLVLGSPIWISLLAAAFIIVLALYIVIWSVILVLYAAVVSVAAGGIAGVCVGVLLMCNAEIAQALLFFGAGLVCAGMTILMIFAANKAAYGAAVISKLIFRGIGYCFVGKRKNI